MSQVEHGPRVGGNQKDTVVINEQTQAGSFVPWQPAPFSTYCELLCQPLAQSGLMMIYEKWKLSPTGNLVEEARVCLTKWLLKKNTDVVKIILNCFLKIYII